MGRFAVVALLLCAHGVRAQPAPESDDDPFSGVEPARPAEAARQPAPHWIDGRLDGITAKLVARYHLAAVGPSGYNNFELILPDNGVVTGAVIVADGVKHRLAFDAAEHGRARFDGVLATAAGPHRRWSVLVSSEFSTSVEVDVTAPRAAMLTIDLEIDAPTCFSHGTRYASVAPDWRASIDRELRMGTAKPEGCVGRPNDDGTPDIPRLWIAFASDDGTWRAPGEQRVVTRAERVDVEHGHFARVEVNLASELTRVPADLHTVFVIDASRSVRESEREAQAKIIESYVQHAHGTQIQIVAFARKAHALLPAWTRAEDAKLAGLAALVPANGSNVDTGLVEAAAWLARTGGTRRVVLFGDERLGKRVAALEANALRGILPANTLVHVIALDAAKPVKPDREAPVRSESIVRADDIAFAELARDTEGLAARGTTSDDRVDALKLVRPIALEQVSVKATGWVQGRIEANEPQCTGDLAEGSACAWYGVADAMPAASVTLEGLLWNHRVRRPITPDAGQRQLLARMLTGYMANLGNAQHELQVIAHAVNEALSLYGEWGGADGYGDESLTELSGSGCGCDAGGMQGGFGFGNPPTVRMFGGLTLAQQLERATAACHVDARVEVSIELTDQEIVDVAVTAPRAALRDCVTEAVWATNLSVNDPQPHAFETIALGS